MYARLSINSLHKCAQHCYNRAEENYEHLAEGFGDVFTEINGLIESLEVTIYGEIYTVIYYLCCDYKVYNKL